MTTLQAGLSKSLIHGRGKNIFFPEDLVRWHVALHHWVSGFFVLVMLHV